MLYALVETLKSDSRRRAEGHVEALAPTRALNWIALDTARNGIAVTVFQFLSFCSHTHIFP